jgi:hypothetical protein
LNRRAQACTTSCAIGDGIVSSAGAHRSTRCPAQRHGKQTLLRCGELP